MNLKDRIYFDNASTTQPFAEVLEVLSQTLSDIYGNPSSTHSFGRSAKSLIESARKNIAKELQVQASEIIFTSGGTEANNLILRGCVRDLGVQTIITSPIEHHAVLHTTELLKTEYHIDIHYVRLTEEGDVDLKHLEELLQKTSRQKVLVSLMHVNNEIGNILPLKKVSELCKLYGAYFHSDMVQSVGHFRLNLNELSVDFMAASAHKFHGIKGVGFAYIQKGIDLNGFIFGGEQERGMRGGTEPLHNIVAMEKAFVQSYKNLEENTLYLSELKQYFIKRIKEVFPDALFNGKSADLRQSTHTIINVGFPSLKQKNDTLLFYLDLKGIACSKGSACQSGSTQNSHVLTAFLPEDRLKIPSLRFSFSQFNTKQEIDTLVDVLSTL
ncbi:cysteine desulfurase family protein [Capnocytophaga felis]|uniref:cysteine desulfurase n=1 Tax=Capnocytophaga felis TaxID=2267611 RepID=A0A5M4B6C1_9FLAO|nr:cysteine desulfurase family protein [Capnocytophaga felis]GET44726.1 cysteine desulfurase [Capnocytophaga felis]GET49694.1 cysteine desulfurase [Capnocytophaga felis]